MLSTFKHSLVGKASDLKSEGGKFVPWVGLVLEKGLMLALMPGNTVGTFKTHSVSSPVKFCFTMVFVIADQTEMAKFFAPCSARVVWINNQHS